MTDEMKKELIRNINNSLGLYELNDFSEEDLKAYNTILNMLNNKKGEHYNSVDEIYEKYNNKVVFYNNKLNDPIQFVLNNNHSPEFTDAANDYSYVKCVYEDNKLAYESKVNALKNLNNKYKTLKGNTYYSEKDLLEKQIVNYKATYDKTKKEYASISNMVKDLGTSYLEKEKEEALKMEEYTETYTKIHNKVFNGVIDISIEAVDNALNTLNRAYESYHNNHSIFGRLFKWVSFTSAYKDYNDFCEVRNAFSSLVGDVVNIKHVNDYLDKKIDLKTFNNMIKLTDTAFDMQHASEYKIPAIIEEDSSKELIDNSFVDIPNKTDELDYSK